MIRGYYSNWCSLDSAACSKRSWRSASGSPTQRSTNGRAPTSSSSDGAALLTDLADELTDDPDAFLHRRCETASGTPVHPSVVLRALLTGHVRRVVLDSRGVVVDDGTKQRLFTGLARQAAMLLTRTCEYPGCELPARRSEIDHNHEWHAGGRTDQANSNIGCARHNRDKHRERWRTRRDARGRAYTIGADGTIILPVGERPPDLTIDEMNEHIRRRLRDSLVRSNG